MRYDHTDRRVYERIPAGLAQGMIASETDEADCEIIDICEEGVGLFLSWDFLQKNTGNTFSLTICDNEFNVDEEEFFIDTIEIECKYKNGQRIGCQISKSNTKYSDYIMKKKVYDFLKRLHSTNETSQKT